MVNSVAGVCIESSVGTGTVRVAEGMVSASSFEYDRRKKHLASQNMQSP